MDIIKGSQGYEDYIKEFILPDDSRQEHYILTLYEDETGDVLVDMVDTDLLYSYNDAYIAADMKKNGFNLIIE